jgi:hypothetical protein
MLKMKKLCPILALAILFIAGCKQAKNANVEANTSDNKTSPLDSHREALAKFQGGQRSFQKLIATIKDEKSFDAAKPRLDKIVSDWRDAATILAKLEPPSEGQQAEFRELVSNVHRITEPTTEDVLSLMSIETRKDEITSWLEQFVAAGKAIGTDILRLYGSSNYPTKNADPSLKFEVTPFSNNIE